MGLEEKLAAVSSEAGLWEAVQERITKQSSRINRDPPRFSKSEAASFIKAGERAGLGAEALVLGYWMRANKESMGSALKEAKAAITGGNSIDDVHRGYDLQYAIDEHLGWMREAGVSVPGQILQELSEHGVVLAQHAKANEYHGWESMPLVEMLGAVLPSGLLRETRISTANNLIWYSFLVNLGDARDAVGVGKALNTLEQYGELNKDAYESIICFVGESFDRSKKTLSALMSTWDWSSHKDDVYGKFVVAMAGQEPGRNSFMFEGKSPLEIFINGYSVFSASNKPSPAIARILAMQLRQLISNGKERPVDSETLLRDLSLKGGGAPDNGCRSALEAMLERELTRVVVAIKPKQLGSMIKLYKAFGGAILGSRLKETVESYVRGGLFNEELSDVVALAEQIGLGPKGNPKLFLEAADSMGKSAQAGVKQVMSLPDRDSITNIKASLENYARRLAYLASQLGDRNIVHEQLRQTAHVLFGTQFGFGLHYLSTLVVEHKRVFDSSPLEIIAAVVEPAKLSRYFAQEVDRTRKARMDDGARQEILCLYDLAHKALYDKPVPRLVREREQEREHKKLEPPCAPKEIEKVVVYVGSKKVDGANRDVAEKFCKGLEGKVKGAVALESGKVPGKGFLYGVAMSPEDFVVSVRNKSMPSPIQAVYLDGKAPVSLDKGKFRMVEADGGVYVQTAPTPETFALHHLGALALALSGSNQEARKTTPHDWYNNILFRAIKGGRR